MIQSFLGGVGEEYSQGLTVFGATDTIVSLTGEGKQTNINISVTKMSTLTSKSTSI